MTHEELIAKVNSLNEEGKRLNELRQKNMGQKEALEKQLNEGIASYNQKYGANITIDTIETELSAVTKTIEEQMVKVEASINNIEKQISDAKAGVTPVQSTPQATPTVTEEVKVAPTPAPVVEEHAPIAEAPITPTVSAPEVPQTPVPTVEATAPVVEESAPVVEQEAPVVPQVPIAEQTVASDAGEIPFAGVFGQSFDETPVAAPEPPKVNDATVPPSFESLIAGSDFEQK